MTTNDPAGDALLLALTDAIRGASTPEIQQAQALLLRRLATEGDVIPSRIPAPRNITEVGGYFNLLTDLAETQLRHNMLSAALGLANEALPATGLGSVPPMRLQSVQNDRPAGPASTTVPLAVAIRNDLAAALQAVLDGVHADGGVLPLWSPPVALPPATAAPGPIPDPLLYLGRRVWLAPTAALTDPTVDSLVLGRASTDPAPGYRVGIRVSPGTVAAPALDWTGLVFDTVSASFVERSVGTVGLLPLSTALAGSPFVATPIPAAPASRMDTAWARLTAIGGLIPGVSTLGAELALVWNSDAVAASVFAGHLDAVWDGTTFVG
jgi:hypothetical protein